jgi:hypothetical protein
VYALYRKQIRDVPQSRRQYILPNPQANWPKFPHLRLLLQIITDFQMHEEFAYVPDCWNPLSPGIRAGTGNMPQAQPQEEAGEAGEGQENKAITKRCGGSLPACQFRPPKPPIPREKLRPFRYTPMRL